MINIGDKVKFSFSTHLKRVISEFCPCCRQKYLFSKEETGEIFVVLDVIDDVDGRQLIKVDPDSTHGSNDCYKHSCYESADMFIKV